MDLLDLYSSTVQNHYQTRKTLPKIWKIELLFFYCQLCHIPLYKSLVLSQQDSKCFLLYRHFSPLFKLDLHIKPDICLTIAILYVSLLAHEACGTGS